MKTLTKEQIIEVLKKHSVEYEMGISRFNIIPDSAFGFIASELLAEDKPTDEEIKKYLFKKYKPIYIKDGDKQFDVNKGYRKSAFEDIKVCRDGLIKPEIKG